VTGRTCRQPMSRALMNIDDPQTPDFFIPTFDHMTLEAEEAVTSDGQPVCDLIG